MDTKAWFGILLIATGILAMLFPHLTSGATMPVSFFIVMLGMVFAFPSLLQGYDKLSQRIAKPASSAGNSPLPVAGSDVAAEAIRAKGKEWVESFPFVTGISVKNKTAGGKDVGAVALVFKVTHKTDPGEYGMIPHYLNYISQSGERYRLLTDVVREDLPQAKAAVSVPIKENKAPFPLGNSISRRNGLTGSIGLVVQQSGDSTGDFIVSCYHVFCSPELMKNNKSFDKGDASAELSCASSGDDGTNMVGVVVKGVMDGRNDFAVAKLARGIAVDNGQATLNHVPSSFGFVFPENVGDTVTMCGRSSGVNSGKIKSHSAAQTISYFQGVVTNFFTGLIEVEPFSLGGDSGGVVVNEKNKVIGLVVAGSPDASYVLPVQDFLISNNFVLKT